MSALAAPAAAVGSVSLQTQLDEDMRALVDNFEGMLRSAQARPSRRCCATRRPKPSRSCRRVLLLCPADAGR